MRLGLTTRTKYTTFILKSKVLWAKLPLNQRKDGFKSAGTHLIVTVGLNLSKYKPSSRCRQSALENLSDNTLGVGVHVSSYFFQSKNITYTSPSAQAAC